jgi:hypothetical protein
MREEMNLNKVVFRFVSISFSILVILLVLIGFVKIGTYCYDFGYRVFTEAPVDAEPGRDVIVRCLCKYTIAKIIAISSNFHKSDQYQQNDKY